MTYMNDNMPADASGPLMAAGQGAERHPLESAVPAHEETLLLAEEHLGSVPEWYAANRKIVDSWRKEVEGVTANLAGILDDFRQRWPGGGAAGFE